MEQAQQLTYLQVKEVLEAMWRGGADYEIYVLDFLAADGWSEDLGSPLRFAYPRLAAYESLIKHIDTAFKWIGQHHPQLPRYVLWERNADEDYLRECRRPYYENNSVRLRMRKSAPK